MWLLHLWYSLKNRKRILLPFSLSINTLFKWHLVYKRNQRRINNTPPLPKKKLGGDMFLYSSGMFRTTGCLLYMYINLYSHSVVINSMRVFIYHLNSILMQELTIIDVSCSLTTILSTYSWYCSCVTNFVLKD